jgi:hypothetical protein
MSFLRARSETPTVRRGAGSPKRITARLVLCIAGGASAWALDAVAQVDVMQACVVASERGQQLRATRVLKEARAEFLACSRVECPAIVAKDCERWFREVEQSLPTVVFSAHDVERRDIASVRVFMDGAPLLEKLDGTAIAMNPGPHKFRFEAAGHPTLERSIVVNEGEKNRNVEVLLETPGLVPREPAVPAARVPVPALVFAGIGVVAAASTAYFGITGISDYDTLRDSCGVSRTCSPSQVDPARTHFFLADMSAGIGLVSLAAAAYLFLSRPSKAEATRAFRWHVVPRGTTTELRVFF